MSKDSEPKREEVPFSWMIRSQFATKKNLDAMFRLFGARRVLPDLYYIRPLVMGSNFLDVREVFESIRSWNDWVDGWSRIGEKREIYARFALEDSRRVTARDNYLFASAAYQMAQLPLYDDVEHRQKIYAKSSECYRYAASLFEPPCAEVTIPFSDHRLPGYLRLPRGKKPAPVMILVCGADSSKEEMHFFSQALVERGIGTLAFDGPGIGETWEELPMVTKYEKVGDALFEFLGGRDDVDGRRIGLLGLSYGGNLVVRIAAHDERPAAVISLSAPYDPSSYADYILPVLQEQVKLLLKDGSAKAFHEWAKSFSIRGLVKKVRAPLLVIGGGEDVIIPGDDAKKIFDEAAGEKKLLYFEEGNHLCAEYAYDLVPRIEEWLIEVGFVGRGRG